MLFFEWDKKHIAIPSLVCWAQVNAGTRAERESRQARDPEPGAYNPTSMPSRSDSVSSSSRLPPPRATTSLFPDAPGPSRARVQPDPDDEEAHLRALLRPPPVDGVDNWGIPARPDGEPDPALVAKLAKFHDLKRRGKHFNDTLMSNKAFRNPHIYEKLVNFVDVDEKGTNFPREIWDPFDYRPEWKAEALAEEQKRRSEALEAAQGRGKRTEISFMSTSKSVEKPRPRERDRERDGREKYEPYPARNKDRDKDEKRSRWDVGAPPRDKKRENGRR
ncbi:HCNGP-domain-containing protein [Calocera viscosa TUFC12733]|uniref:HCNGP-domain-containing protein n=1 Tax=Calocera viscosa (strain TUFC12733) TaxID=1330018 RepID=A0A167L5C1_CALVF|nr:HCNGP-domain-containing protein [Calocera viscosa TUFC12733]